MKPFNTALLTTLLLAGTALCQADVYKWYDADGNVNYGEQPPTGIESELFLRTTKSATTQRTSSAADHHQSIKNYLDTVDARQQQQQTDPQSQPAVVSTTVSQSQSSQP